MRLYTEMGWLFTTTTVYVKQARRSEAECSHEAAGEEINKTFCIKDQVARISSGKVAGRPKKRLAVGYSAHKPDEYSDRELGRHDYEAWMCELTVQFFNLPYSQQPFVRKITGTTPIKTNAIITI